MTEKKYDRKTCIADYGAMSYMLTNEENMINL